MRDLAELQRLFVEAKDFSAFWNAFLDDWAMQPWFMKRSAPAETAEMEVLVAYIIGKMYGRAVEPEAMRLLKIAGAGVVHGAFKIEGGLAGVLYFEDIERGLIAAPGVGTKVHYARFTWQFAGRPQFVNAPRNPPGGSGLPN